MRVVATSIITLLKRFIASFLSPVISRVVGLRRASCYDELSCCRTRPYRIVKRTLATVCESDNHLIVAFPMPRCTLDSTRIAASPTSVTVEARGTVILMHQFDRGRHNPAFVISMTVRHIRRLPFEVDASHGFATLDERHKMLLVHLPKVMARQSE